MRILSCAALHCLPVFFRNLKFHMTIERDTKEINVKLSILWLRYETILLLRFKTNRKMK